MRIFNSRIGAMMISVATAMAVMGSEGTAFSASSAAQDHKGGHGVGTISGYVVDDVAYTYNSGDGMTITNVEFRLDGAARTVKARVKSSADATTVYVECEASINTAVEANHWTCDIADVTVMNASALEVFAANI